MKFKKFTPHAGVWIETLLLTNMAKISPSHPMRVCGLKLGIAVF